MKDMLKNARIAKGLKTTQVATLLNIDAALISKFESGHRTPTRAQLVQLAALFEINFDELLILWLKEKILQQVGDEPLAEKALQAALQQISGHTPASAEIPVSFQKLMDEMETLKNILAPKTP